MLASKDMTPVLDRIQQEKVIGRRPLFILGSGISSEVVPFLWEFVAWLRDELPESSEQWIGEHADALCSKTRATRRVAAEFFSALQESDELRNLWSRFSQGVLIKGLEFKSRKPFPGLSSVRPTSAHEKLASLLHASEAYVISLNFDGLTHKASMLPAVGSDKPRTAVAIHTPEEIDGYFTAATKEYFPAVIKIRGDVFYARCSNVACYLYRHPYPIDRLHSSSALSPDTLACPNCNHPELLLQFQFPGYREKEETADPMLKACRRYLASRLSVIAIVGLSGRWDRYMLKFLFDLAKEHDLMVADIKPPDSENLIADFREQYYPSIPALDGTQDVHGACFARVRLKASDFFEAYK